MSWGEAVLLRLVAAAGMVYFVNAETEGVYEFLLADQGSFNYIVKIGCGFAVAGALLPMYAGHLFNQRQYIAGTACWLVTPFVISLVLYAAVQRVGGTADQAQLQRDRATRAGTLAAKTEASATKAWEDARDAASTECTSGPVNKRRGEKCNLAEGKMDAAWDILIAAREALRKAPEAHPDSGARRVASVLPMTEAQVRLYQPMIIPVVTALLAALCATLAMTLKTPSMPRPWQHWRWPQPSTLPANLPARIAPLPKPRLVSDHRPVGSADDYVVARIEVAKGNQIEFGEMYTDCESWCRTKALDPQTPEQFAEAMKRICEAAGIRIRRKGETAFFVGVRFAASMGKETTHG